MPGNYPKEIIQQVDGYLQTIVSAFYTIVTRLVGGYLQTKLSADNKILAAAGRYEYVSPEENVSCNRDMYVVMSRRKNPIKIK
jgi:predicted esterase YcpF (UPF0227 family)